jgi:hypothetical protein
MAFKKAELVKSPEGIAVYPWLNKPDTKFNPDGEYRTKLRIPAEEAQGFITKLMAIYEANVAEQTKIAKKKVKAANLPWAETFDEEGNEDGFIEFSFKRKAKVTMKDGSQFESKVALFDSANNPLPADVSVYGGSTIVIAAEVVPYYTATVGAGITLRLKAVQVKKLVQGGGNGGASSFGFDADEDGYKAPAKETFEDAANSVSEEDF